MVLVHYTGARALHVWRGRYGEENIAGRRCMGLRGAYATYAWAYATAYVFYRTQERDFIQLLNTKRDFQLTYCRASMKLNQQY
jgi:hypothetical protein